MAKSAGHVGALLGDFMVYGIGRFLADPVPGSDQGHVLTSDDVMNGAEVSGNVVIYDEDGTYIANVIAEKLVIEGCNTTIVTPMSEIAPYLALTMEQHKVVPRLLQLGVRLERLKMLSGISDSEVELSCVHGGRGFSLTANHVIMITSRLPNDRVYQELMAQPEDWKEAGVKSVSRIGDCEAPNIIAAAVHSGHRWARSLDNRGVSEVPNLPERSP